MTSNLLTQNLFNTLEGAEDSLFSTESIVPESIGFLFEQEKTPYTRLQAQEDITLINAIEHDPTIDKESLLAIVGSTYSESPTRPENNMFLNSHITKILGRRDAITAVLQKYESPEQVFEGLFGRVPNGQVQLVGGPLSIDFVCFDPKDYEFVYGGSYSNYPRGTIQHGTTGCVVKGCKEPTLDLAVTCVSGDEASKPPVDDMLKHEKQHIVNWLFMDNEQRDFIENFPDPETFIASVSSLSDEEFADSLREYLVTTRELTLEYGDKDEISAYLSQGMTPRQAWVVAKQGYGYGTKIPEYLQKSLGQGLSQSKGFILRGLVESTFSAYEEHTFALIMQVEDMLKKGFTNQEAAMLLNNRHMRQILQ